MLSAASRLGHERHALGLKSIRNVSLMGRLHRPWSGVDLKEAQKVIRQVARSQVDCMSQVIPWFLGTMPPDYFREVPQEIRSLHLVAAGALYTFKPTDMYIKLYHRPHDESDLSKADLSIVRSGQIVHEIDMDEMMSGLQEICSGDASRAQLTRIKVYTTADKLLSLSLVSFDLTDMRLTPATPTPPILKRQPIWPPAPLPRLLTSPPPLITPRPPEESFSHAPVDAKAAAQMEPAGEELRALEEEMILSVRDNEDTAVHISSVVDDPEAAWVTVVMANTSPSKDLKRLLHFLYANNLDILRVFARSETVDLPLPLPTEDWKNNVAVFRVAVKQTEIPGAAPSSLIGPIKRLRWLSDEVIQLGLVKFPFLGVNRAEVIISLCRMMHGTLNKLNPRAFPSTLSTFKILESDPEFVRAAAHVADLFFEKFAIRLEEDADEDLSRQHQVAYRQQLYQSEKSAGASSQYSSDVILLLTNMLDAVNAIARTNFHRIDRFALSFIVDSAVLMADPSKPKPFCVYYCYGRDFSAFHCRFSNIARGGMRVVTPPNRAAHAIASGRHFDEVYDLAYAQQLKNKDIPAGGAKAVILVRTCGPWTLGSATPEARFNTIRRTIRAFSDSMLDLVVGAAVSNMVDFWRGEERLFFGPDEQVVAGDVEWITQRAMVRGYQTPSTIMTSKGGAGINHKEFGVTSEGVLVYLDVAVRKYLGIDPKVDTFSVKITGGPDGDVAGNLMRFLIRDYPDTVKIVGVADGFGVAEDPFGLDHTELLRLINANKSINHFHPDKLTASGTVDGECCVLDASSAEGARRRNRMAFDVQSDVFVPGGGRPGTINAHNWRRFLTADGTGVPSSRLIVEGANLFVSGEARQLLCGEGVGIIKDSSANKGGVIASSFEVQALMVMSTDEFIRIKKEIVADVLQKIRAAARSEASLLFNEYDKGEKTLPELSEAISQAINHLKTLLEDHMCGLDDSDPTLREAFDMARNDSLLPCVSAIVKSNWALLPNCRSLAASALASHFVYNEGIRAASKIPNERIFDVVTGYFRSSLELQQFINYLSTEPITSMTEEEKEVVINALTTNGTRAAIERDMRLEHHNRHRS